MKRILLLVTLVLLVGCVEEPKTVEETISKPMPNVYVHTEGKLLLSGGCDNNYARVMVWEICENGYMKYLYSYDGYGDSGAFKLVPKLDFEGNPVRCTEHNR